ncbi:MAG TPA: hypothetical protein H9861_04590 [Candidatus Ligilactobacillus excrementigallinarum]|uniref:Uncharacterized protein n=1 Tax=Candidatus Ligilactobacillus excrementigallinarum TaxID=2838641 RepID=A0A9D1UX46_9LACO|nr:hypothetical protein [Candidatus Ligilactobacillus excrementigallinarum]
MSQPQLQLLFNRKISKILQILKTIISVKKITFYNDFRTTYYLGLD